MSNILKIAGAGVSAAAEETDPNFNQTVLLLHGDGTNGAQNNTFLDSSTNNFTVTRNGNTTQGTFSPFSVAEGEWSNYFDGTGDYLTAPDDTDFSLGSNEWTIECWIYNGTTSAQKFIAGQTSSAGSNNATSFLLLKTSTNKLQCSVCSGGTGYDAVGATDIPLNSWVHVCAVRDGDLMRIYLNGTQDGTQDLTGVTINNVSDVVGVGRAGAFATNPFDGYISNFRIVNGTCVYPSGTAFTPPTAPLTAITNTSLLTCQSNRFVDNSSNAFAITRNGDVKVTPFSPFAPTAAYSASVNGGSGYFDGSDSLSFTNESAVQLTNAAAWTIEFWVYATTTSDQEFILNYTGSGTFEGYAISVFSNNIRFWDGNAWTNIGATIQTILNQWAHIAVSYEGSGSTRRFFVNGKQVGSAGTVNANINRTTTGTAYIAETGASTNYVTGWMTGVRIVKGSALYTADFPIPTSPPTNISGTGILLNFTNAGIFDQTGKNNLETVGNAQIDTTTKKFGTGSMEFDGTGDRLFATDTLNWSFGSGNFTIECWFNSTDAGQYSSLASADYTPTSVGWALLLNSTSNDGKIAFFEGSIAPSLLITSTGSYNDGNWHHVAVVRNGTSLAIYVDGVSEASSTVSGAVSLVGNLYIGASIINANRDLSGFIDDLRITKGVARDGTVVPTKEFPNL